MILIDKIEVFERDDLNNPKYIKELDGDHKIKVEWVYHNEYYCTKMYYPWNMRMTAYFLGGEYFGRMKIHFNNGIIWDTLLKTDDEWRWKIFNELDKYVDSGYTKLPGKSSLEQAAELLDDSEEFEDI